jgi:FkbM family methyltransferase
MLTRSILTRLGLLSRFNITDKLSLNGRQFKIPVIQGLAASITEAWMQQLLINLKPLFRKHFVDVGVNMGQTLLNVQSVLPNAAYLGFEPNSTCVHYVRKLIGANGFHNCEIIPAALSDESMALKLNYYATHDEADESASIIENFRPEQKVISSHYVPVLGGHALENVLPLGEPAFLKIDVEGAELEVIRGLQSWIAVNRPVILMEILPVYFSGHYQARLPRQQEMEQIFKSLGYRLARVNKQDSSKLQLVEEIGVHDNMEWSDYVIFHSSRLAELEQHFSLH